jgi:phosphoglycerate dehydrogenase-like enzyme
VSGGHARRAHPRIAVGPEPADWAAEAIRSGGGEAGTLDHDPVGLVWTGGIVADDLRRVLAAHPGIAWVQLPLAGVDTLAEAGVIDRQRQWTSAKGAFAEPVAEHALALLLAGLRQLPMRARARSWGEPGAATLFDQPVTVVGGGGLATVLLRLLEPFRSPVTIVRHRPEPLPGAARTVGTDRLAEALAGARAVVLMLALTPGTRKLIGRAELAAMERDAWLVNVARGAVVDTSALVDALRSGQIGGAALDVTDPEPPPPDDPLLSAPNLIVAPHIGSATHTAREAMATRAVDNLLAALDGQPMPHPVDTP